MSTKKLLKAFGLLLVVGLLFAVAPTGQAKAADTAVACTGTGDTAQLQGAIDSAAAGDVITVSGTCVLESVVNVNKAVTLQAASDAKIQVSGTGDRFDISAAATLTGFKIQKTDKTAPQDIIRIRASGINITNNEIWGEWIVGDGEVTRAMVMNAGAFTDILISGNTIHHLRQPLYISGTNTGTISNNFVHDTKGFVVEGGNMTFTGNTWANNVGDIAILPQVPAQYYTDILALSAANNNAVVEDQRVIPAVLSVAYVDDSAAAGGNGTEASPYQSIQAGINRVIAGGTVNVAAGTYTQEGALVVSTPNLTIKLSSGTVIQNNSPCFVVNASDSSIIAEPGAKCIPTGGANGIDVAENLTNIRVEGLEITGIDPVTEEDLSTGDGIYFAGSVNGVDLVSNNIHDLDGDAITFATAPTGSVTIAFNRFYNNDSGINILDSAVTGAESMSDSLIAENNWWGCNAGPGDIRCDSASQIVDYDPWLVLKITSEKQIVKPDEEIQIDANLIYNSAGQNTLSDGYVPNGITAEFSVQPPGSVDPVSTETVQGQVSTSFTPTEGGVFNVCVTVDNQTECTEDIVVPAAAAVDDEYRMMFNSTLDVDIAEGVTKNDTGITVDFGYTVSLVSGPEHGQLELKADGSFKYIPEANFVGDDSFVYQLVIYPSKPAPANGNPNPWLDQAMVKISVEAYKIFIPLIQK